MPARTCSATPDQGFSQFSTAKPGTRRNSRSLLVTTGITQSMLALRRYPASPNCVRYAVGVRPSRRLK